MLKLRKKAEDTSEEGASPLRIREFSAADPDFLINLFVLLGLWAVLFDVLLGP